MKLKDWLKDLNSMIAVNPEILEYELIYSSDDEGNSFHKVISEPTLVQLEDVDKYYIELVGFDGDETINTKDCNAICIN